MIIEELTLAWLLNQEHPVEVWKEAFIQERKNFMAIDQANYQCLSDRKYYKSSTDKLVKFSNQLLKKCGSRCRKVKRPKL